MTSPSNHALHNAFAPARELQPTDAEVQRVLSINAARATRRQRPPVLRLAIAAFAMIAVVLGAYAAPPTRAALHDVYSTITGWVAGDDQQPGLGQALGPHGDAPAWVRATPGDKRLVAKNGAAKLYAIRGQSDTISFALGGSVGLSDSVDGWRKRLAGHQVVLLGPGAFPGGPLDDHGRRPLFGVTSSTVARVELRYATGAASVQDNVAGGFVLLADAHRKPRSLVAFDQAANEVDHVDLGGLELRVCSDVRGCPPGHWTPSTSNK